MYWGEIVKDQIFLVDNLRYLMLSDFKRNGQWENQLRNCRWGGVRRGGLVDIPGSKSDMNRPECAFRPPNLRKDAEGWGTLSVP